MMGTKTPYVLFQPLDDFHIHNSSNLTIYNYNLLAEDGLTSLEDIMTDFTNQLYTYNDPVVIALLTFYVPIFLLALVGNVMVLIITFSSGGIRNVTNSFLLNLSCADLLGRYFKGSWGCFFVCVVCVCVGWEWGGKNGWCMCVGEGLGVWEWVCGSGCVGSGLWECVCVGIGKHPYCYINVYCLIM